MPQKPRIGGLSAHYGDPLAISICITCPDRDIDRDEGRNAENANRSLNKNESFPRFLEQCASVAVTLLREATVRR